MGEGEEVWSWDGISIAFHFEKPLHNLRYILHIFSLNTLVKTKHFTNGTLEQKLQTRDEGKCVMPLITSLQGPDTFEKPKHALDIS